MARRKREADAVLELPAEKKKPNFNLSAYTTLIYGREKIGKSTIFSSFPNALFLTTEPGTKGMEIFEFNSENGGVNSWDVFRQAVKLLQKSKDFQNVIIDTVDRAYDMCLDWVCENRGVEYPGETASGENDWGKSWRAVKNEFMTQIHAILRTGRGVSFSSHVKEETITPRTGAPYTRIYPSMGNQCRKVVEALVDLFFYAEYMRDSSGKIKRVLITKGDETIWAGHRKTENVAFPQFIEMLEEDGYTEIQKCFAGNSSGVDPEDLLASKSTSKTGKKFLTIAKADSLTKAKQKKPERRAAAARGKRK